MKHCILVKYQAAVDAEKRASLPAEVRRLFAPLTTIDGIRGVEVIENVIDRPNRYDLLIRIDMEKTALPVYDESEPHRIWKRDYSGFLEKKAIFDYDD